VGNRVQKTLTTLAGTETTVYTYDADDRLIEETTTAGGVATTTQYTWDANGRLLKKITPTETTRYGWDREDHLVEVKRGATEATAIVQATYAYDAQGNRVRKTEKTAQGDKVTTYLTDTTFPYAQVVEEKVKLGTHTETTRYVWGEGLIAQLQNGQARYVHADGLGSVQALSDGRGALTDAYAYAAFGEVLGHVGTSAQPYRFAGEHYDPVAGMQYHRARWYDPAVGRFTALDPHSGYQTKPQTLNKYGYAANDPVNKLDPSGEMLIGSVSISLSSISSIATFSLQVWNAWDKIDSILTLAQSTRMLYSAFQYFSGPDFHVGMAAEKDFANMLMNYDDALITLARNMHTVISHLTTHPKARNKIATFVKQPKNNILIYGPTPEHDKTPWPTVDIGQIRLGNLTTRLGSRQVILSLGRASGQGGRVIGLGSSHGTAKTQGDQWFRMDWHSVSGHAASSRDIDDPPFHFHTRTVK
jgi:RHS repeat-associated protein